MSGPLVEPLLFSVKRLHVLRVSRIYSKLLPVIHEHFIPYFLWLNVFTVQCGIHEAVSVSSWMNLNAFRVLFIGVGWGNMQMNKILSIFWLFVVTFCTKVREKASGNLLPLHLISPFI